MFKSPIARMHVCAHTHTPTLLLQILLPPQRKYVDISAMFFFILCTLSEISRISLITHLRTHSLCSNLSSFSMLT